MKKALILTVLVLFPLICLAQVDTGVKVTDAQQGGEMLDSVKQAPYPYLLPILGKKAAAKGFLLPYPVGIMLNVFRGSQKVDITDLTVGIDAADGSSILEPTSLDDVLEFGEVRATVSNFNFRTDVWLLPFLDIYGIVGAAWVKTDVNIASIMNQPVDINTSANFRGLVYGFGAMLTGGIRSVFISGDFNMVWTHFKEMENNNRAINLSLRTGYVFHLKKERNIAVWLGAGRIFLNNETVGSVKLSDVAPDLGGNYTSEQWYQDLPPALQTAADRVVANYVDKHMGDVVKYSLRKSPTSNWTMIIGAQYQPNRRWQFRTEINLMGGHRSGLLSANYRFGFK